MAEAATIRVALSGDATRLVDALTAAGRLERDLHQLQRALGRALGLGRPALGLARDVQELQHALAAELVERFNPAPNVTAAEAIAAVADFIESCACSCDDFDAGGRACARCAALGMHTGVRLPW